MGFELVEKSTRKIMIANMVRVGKSGFTFGADSMELLKNSEYMEIYLDRDNNRVGFKPTDNSITGFKLSNKDIKIGHRLTNNTTVKYLPEGLYQMIIEDGMIVIKVESIAVK